MPMNIQVSGESHQGLKRSQNQDHFLINRNLELFVVADGVETCPYGELASRMVVEELEKIIHDLDIDADATPPFEDFEGLPLPLRSLKFAVREVNRRIYSKANEEARYQGMGSTLTALWLRENRAYIAHVGDSRAYLIRNRIAQQLTRDHTSLSEKDLNQQADMETYEEYAPLSEHELTRALGVNPDVQVQLASGSPRSGDFLVLCTDGLYTEVRNFEISDAVLSNPVPRATMKLIQLANSRGGKDNIALIVIKVV
jgi:serine/threonine protein phosphatase PrpC